MKVKTKHMIINANYIINTAADHVQTECMTKGLLHLLSCNPCYCQTASSSECGVLIPVAAQVMCRHSNAFTRRSGRKT